MYSTLTIAWLDQLSVLQVVVNAYDRVNILCHLGAQDLLELSAANLALGVVELAVERHDLEARFR